MNKPPQRVFDMGGTQVSDVEVVAVVVVSCDAVWSGTRLLDYQS